MCLTRVNTIFKSPITDIKTGYKIFNLNNNGKNRKRVSFRYRSRDYSLRLDRWIHDKSRLKLKCAKTFVSFFDEEPDNNLKIRRVEIYYPSGFHLFESMYEALSYNSGNEKNILEIKYKNVLAVGEQGDHKCVIARSIFIPSVENKKKLYVPIKS